MNKNWLIALVVVIVLLGGYLIFARYKAPAPTMQPSAAPTAGASTTTQPSETQGATVTYTSNGFEPKTITIKAGEKVTWMNKSGSDISINSNSHPTHLLYPPLNLGVVHDGQSVSLVFPKTGTFGYHNHLDPAQKAEVVVQ